MRRSISCGAYTLSITATDLKPTGRCDYSGRAARTKPRSTRGAMQKEVGEQWRGSTGAALGRAALVGGAGDVEVSPLQPQSELGEERRRRDRTAVAAAHVGEVGEVALELVRIFIGERQRPAAVVGARSGILQLAHQRLVIAHHARMMMAERHDAGAGEGRQIDHRRRPEPSRVVQGVAKDQPSLGVGVENLDRLTRGAGRDIAGLDGLAARHVLDRGDEPDDVQRKAQRCGEGDRGNYRGGAAHVEFHLVHAGGILERDPATVESDTLAHQYDRRQCLLRALVLENDEARRLVTALRNCEQAAHLLAPDRGLIEHPYPYPALAPGQGARLLGKKARRTEVAGKIGQVALHSHRRRHGLAVLQPTLGGRSLAYRAGEHPGERGRPRFLPGLQVVDAIERAAGDLGDSAPEIVVVELLQLGAIERHGAAGDARTRQRRRRRGPCLTPAPALKLLSRAEPREQYVRRADAGEVADQQRIAGAPEEIAALEDLLQPPATGGIDTAGFAAELPLLEYAEHQAVHGERRQALRPDPKLHAIFPFSLRRAAV